MALQKKWLSIFGAIIMFSSGLLYWIVFTSNTNFNTKSKEIIITKDLSSDSVVSKLKNDSIINNNTSFTIVKSLLKYNDQAVKPGRYLFKSGMSNLDMIRKLRSGNQDPVSITINNVRDTKQLCAKFGQQLMLDSTELFSMLSDTILLDSMGFNRENILSLFIPNTYEMYYTISPRKLIAKFSSEYEKFWSNNNRRAEIQKRNITEAQAYTVASIVEKETIYEAEKKTIAAVYLNRLKTGIKLQADPTVVFALGIFGIQRILFEHLSTNSPYNTYLVNGLPPGPICMPSQTSLDAVINSEEHDFLFFCAKPGYDGSHSFAKNFQAHSQNANEYRKWLDKEKIK
ncbi:MAG: endolytic transglycosylase MltG [Saprospiraceae bacterium]|nr:endolytic transglycosylase MltG [Saprospiraceae bacterium]